MAAAAQENIDKKMGNWNKIPKKRKYRLFCDLSNFSKNTLGQFSQRLKNLALAHGGNFKPTSIDRLEILTLVMDETTAEEPFSTISYNSGPIEMNIQSLRYDSATKSVQASLVFPSNGGMLNILLLELNRAAFGTPNLQSGINLGTMELSKKGQAKLDRMSFEAALAREIFSSRLYTTDLFLASGPEGKLEKKLRLVALGATFTFMTEHAKQKYISGCKDPETGQRQTIEAFLRTYSINYKDEQEDVEKMDEALNLVPSVMPDDAEFVNKDFLNHLSLLYDRKLAPDSENLVKLLKVAVQNFQTLARSYLILDTLTRGLDSYSIELDQYKLIYEYLKDIIKESEQQKINIFAEDDFMPYIRPDSPKPKPEPAPVPGKEKSETLIEHKIQTYTGRGFSTKADINGLKEQPARNLGFMSLATKPLSRQSISGASAAGGRTYASVSAAGPSAPLSRSEISDKSSDLELSEAGFGLDSKRDDSSKPLEPKVLNFDEIPVDSIVKVDASGVELDATGKPVLGLGSQLVAKETLSSAQHTDAEWSGEEGGEDLDLTVKPVPSPVTNSAVVQRFRDKKDSLSVQQIQEGLAALGLSSPVIKAELDRIKETQAEIVEKKILSLKKSQPSETNLDLSKLSTITPARPKLAVPENTSIGSESEAEFSTPSAAATRETIKAVVHHTDVKENHLYEEVK